MVVSIAMPLYQGEAYLEETLQSILQQTRLPDEVVLSDDGSTDATVGIARAFAERAPFAVKLLRSDRSGPTGNYLNALAATTGDIIIFGDQDDVWKSTRVAAIERCFAEDPEVSLVAADSELVDCSLTPLGTTVRGGMTRSEALSRRVSAGDDFLEYLRGMSLLAHSLAVHRVCRAPLLDKPEEPAEWWFESWASFVALCHGRLALIPEALTLYRQHAAQTSGAPVSSGHLSTPIEKYRNRAAKVRYCRELLERSRGGSLFSEAERRRRVLLADRYRDFLEKRIALRQSGWRGFMLGAGLFFSGEYRRFARGWRSYAKDLVS